MLFFALWYFNIAVRPFEDSIGSSRTLHYILNYLLAGLIPTGALFLLHARRDIASSMGLSHGFGTGLLFAVTATLPMITGYAVIGEFDRELSADEAFTWIFIAGMFEELVYRGFVFGQLFRYARWGFLPAALLAALAFGSLHLYQGHDPVSALTAFGVTALGSIFFSWLYVEWNYNLWSVIWLHTLMNLPWIVFRDRVPRKYERRRRRHRGQRVAALHHNSGNRPDCCIQEETGTTLPNTDQYINYQ